MRALSRFLRSILIWAGPVLVLLLAIVAGFGFWVVKSEPGTRWAIGLGVTLAGGQVERIDGNLWNGVQVGHLALDTPAVTVDAQDLVLQVDWPALQQRRVHLRNLSVGQLSLNILASDEPASDEPFSMPALPVTLALDRFHLGELSVSLNDEPILLKVKSLEASMVVSEEEAQLVFRKLELGQQDIEASVEGEFRLLALADPWPFSAWIQTDAKSQTPDSLLCARRFLPTLPVAQSGEAGTAKTKPQSQSESATELDAVSTFCAINLQARAEGSMHAAHITLKGQGQDIQLEAAAQLLPDQAFPLRSANWLLALSDGSSLKGDVSWAGDEQGAVNPNHLVGQIELSRLNLGMLLPEALPQASLSSQLDFDVQLRNQSALQSARLKLRIDESSVWNAEPLSGHIDFQLLNTDTSNSSVLAPESLEVQTLDMALRLGANQVTASGDLGYARSGIDLNVQAPGLASFWPDLEGSAELQARLDGGLADHRLTLQGQYDAGGTGGDTLGDAPVQLETALQGAWKHNTSDPAQSAWEGRLGVLQVKHAGAEVSLRSPLNITVKPNAAKPDYLLSLGQTSIGIALHSRNEVQIDHQQTLFSPGRWRTSGDINPLTISKSVIDEMMELVGQKQPEHPSDERGRVIVDVDDRDDMVDMTYAVNWDLGFQGALSGNAQIRWLEGEVVVPGDPPVPLGLRTLQADMTATPTSGGSSRIQADVNIETARMGQAHVQAQTLLRATPEGAISYNPDDGTTAQVQATLENIGWLSLFTGDATEIGGALQVDLTARSEAGGNWETQGSVRGEQIRIVRIDDGVRLIDGTLEAHFEGDRFVLDKLSFPAVRRAVPKEWRTEKWTRENPEAQGGSLTLTGYWDIPGSVGNVDINLYRYPIMQRSDRFAMVSGELSVDMPSPALNIEGALTVDAGWIDLDMLSSVPTVDSDVVVIRPGQQQVESSPLDISVDISIDLGPRFYITGYGVDSGLVGEMRIVMTPQSRPAAYGVLRTRGGAIEAYGQRLQLRRGTITFQGPIASPVLNIEALRTGVAVEAGVRVSGTARSPKISLISYPDVADVQKLSWLLLGRGSDDSGGDAALLFSVGTSLLGDGEPFYRKFGLDEVSMRSGELGSVGSILPAQTVVPEPDSDTSNTERQFMVAAKHLTNGITLSLEQALTDTGTVGRVSYQLARGLSAQLSAGTISGLALVWRAFSRD